jgi:hypothetical protein
MILGPDARLFKQEIRGDFALAVAKNGNTTSAAIAIPMKVTKMTTINSRRVNAFRRRNSIGFIGIVLTGIF